ncbi:hypothetical protein GCM10010300_84770 [Streptomyces olivaceoviridis]|nr:hypothetical protein GCM10010300_84770 [Streptomyces olivaceoviridis]
MRSPSAAVAVTPVTTWRQRYVTRWTGGPCRRPSLGRASASGFPRPGRPAGFGAPVHVQDPDAQPYDVLRSLLQHSPRLPQGLKSAGRLKAAGLRASNSFRPDARFSGPQLIAIPEARRLSSAGYASAGHVLTSPDAVAGAGSSSCSPNGARGTGGPNGRGLARRGSPGCPFPARPGLDGTGAARDA